MAACLGGCRSSGELPTTPNTPSAAPASSRATEGTDVAVAFLDETGAPRDPFATMNGPGLVLIFIRNDCPISNRYAPTIQELVRSLRPRGIDFWLVDPDPRSSCEEVRAHLQEYALPCGALLDPTHRLVARADAQVTPQAALFDRTGRLRYSGRIDDRFVDFGVARAKATTHELRDAVEALLEGRDFPSSSAPAIGCLIADLAPAAPVPGTSSPSPEARE